MDELNRLSQAEQLEGKHHFPISIILDNVRSMNNVGSVFRTADAFNVASIMLCGVTPTPPHREIQKTALGATESVAWQYSADITEAITTLRSKGYNIIAIEQVHDSEDLSTQDWKSSKSPIAFIFGNEVEGVSAEALDLCDYAIEIPQYGSKHSLNISVSVGVILWDYIRQLNN